MIHIGLTGGIATGKSTVSKMFRDKGAVLLNLDEIAHMVMEPEKPAWKAIVRAFGDKILLDDKTINREELAKIVFRDRARLKELESIVHPAVLDHWGSLVSNIAQQNPEAILISEVPLLFEKNLATNFDATLLVYAPVHIQIKRLMERDSILREEAERRLKAQIPIDDKLRLATYVIYNDSTLAKTRKQVETLWNKLLTQVVK